MRTLHTLVSSAVIALLAAKDAMAATGASRSSEATNSAMIVPVVIGVGVLVALGVVAEVVRRMLQYQRRYSHKGLFNGLCRTHGLDRSARALLWDVACVHNLAQPARVFTEPQWLDPAGLQNSLGLRAAEAAILHGQLFGKPEDGDASSPQGGPAAR
jgi:hypothetical protein